MIRDALEHSARGGILDRLASLSDSRMCASVMRPSVQRQVRTPCLVLAQDTDEHTMLELLARWMGFDDRDYYRVQSAKSRAVCFTMP